MFGPSESGRPSGKRAVGILVHLHEERVDAERDRGARERGYVLALAAGAVAGASRELDRVGRVENDGDIRWHA